jgi:hypothetical protein
MAYDGQQCQNQSTDGLNNNQGKPSPPWKAPPKPKPAPYKNFLPPKGSIHFGVYNPDWQPGVNPIPYLAATLRLECFGEASMAACDALGDPESWAGPRACGSDPYVCLIKFFALSAGGMALLAAGGAVVGPSVETAKAGGVTLAAWLAALREKLQGGQGAPLASTGTSAAESAAGAALKFPKDLIPKGLEQSEWGFKIWGRGAQAALDLIGRRSAADLRAIGLTPEGAQRLADFYRAAAAAGRGGQAAQNRVKLMEDIIKTLGGDG